MKSKLILSVCLCFSLIVPSISFGQEIQTYKNFSEGIQISYPSNWIYSEGKQPLPPSVFFVPENESNLAKPQMEQAVFLLIAHDTTGGYSNIPLDSYLDHSLRQLHERSVNVNMTNKTVIAGIPAYQLFFTNPNGNKVELTITVYNGSPYAISYNSSPDKYDLYLPAIQKMLSTLKFI